ncbi:MAG TPA: hypothetical protein VG247_17165 [Pseudonocardiaceae bacterium]|jgi:basic membrane lipoprotein Med (substrate-binding protein (PBP1-ABC) superfamily)|nr:hypothetical protein [Pseudonocardiaceae bacterium]
MTTAKRIMASVTRHRALAAGITAAVFVATTISVIVAWPNKPATQQVAYTNISRNYKTCLLTTTQNSFQAAPIWKAIRQATTHAPINAQQLTPPTGTTAQLVPYFNSLIALHCQLIVTTGTDLTDALATTATNNPDSHFVNIGTAINQPNIHTIITPLANPDVITTYVLNATHGKY